MCEFGVSDHLFNSMYGLLMSSQSSVTSAKCCFQSSTLSFHVSGIFLTVQSALLFAQQSQRACGLCEETHTH